VCVPLKTKECEIYCDRHVLFLNTGGARTQDMDNHYLAVHSPFITTSYRLRCFMFLKTSDKFLFIFVHYKSSHPALQICMVAKCRVLEAVWGFLSDGPLKSSIWIPKSSPGNSDQNQTSSDSSCAIHNDIIYQRENP
jgi:hypothetical protein